MNAPYIHGRRRTFSASAAVDTQNAVITSIKTDDGATWGDMGRVLGKSEDRAAAYANTASPIDLPTFLAGWAAGTKGGIFDRNTARADFEMGPVDGGNEPWVQQQDIPLSVAARAAKEPSVPPVPPEPVALPVEAPEDQARRYEALRQKEASQIYG